MSGLSRRSLYASPHQRAEDIEHAAADIRTAAIAVHELQRCRPATHSRVFLKFPPLNVGKRGMNNFSMMDKMIEIGCDEVTREAVFEAVRRDIGRAVTDADGHVYRVTGLRGSVDPTDGSMPYSVSVTLSPVSGKTEGIEFLAAF